MSLLYFPGKRKKTTFHSISGKMKTPAVPKETESLQSEEGVPSPQLRQDLPVHSRCSIQGKEKGFV